MRRSPLSFLAASLLALAVIASIAASPAHAGAPAVIQQNYGDCTSGANCAATFSSFPSNGDTTVVVVSCRDISFHLSCEFAPNEVTETGTTLSLVTTITGYGGYTTASIFAGTPCLGCAKTVTVYNSGVTIRGEMAVMAYEVSNIDNAVNVVASGSCGPTLCGTAYSTSSRAFSYSASTYFAVGGEADSGTATITPGASYTVYQPFSWASEYSLTVASPTTFPMTAGTSQSYWAEVGAVFGPAPSTPAQSTTTTTSTVTTSTTTTTSVSCTSTTTTTTTTTVTVTTTTFATQLQYTVTTNPPGLAASINVDGVVYNSPATFNWTPGSTHTIIALSPCNLQNSPYTAFSFVSWSDGGSQNHQVIAPASSTVYTANFQTTAQTVTCGSPNPLQQLEVGCIVPALLGAWSAGIGLQPWLGFILLGVNVAVFNKTQSVWLTLLILWVTGATFFLFLPTYVGLVAQVFLYLGAAGLVVKGILAIRS